jgi:hypothetical protein
MNIRLDSVGLINSFGAIANNLTGINTARDKTTNISIGRGRQLSQSQLEALFEDELIRRVVCLLPENATKAWFNLSVPDNKLGDDLPELILTYLDILCDRDDQTEAETESEIYGVKEAFLIASILARQFGKAYILIGIDDNESFDKPVNKNRINSIRWLRVLENWELRPERSRRMRSPIFYQLNSDDIVSGKVHKSRVLPFYGNRIYSKFGSNIEDGISIIQSMFDAYIDWLQGIKAGS